MTARLTIGIPVYNGASTIKRALESIDTQTFRDFKVVIADNASTDPTPSILRSWADRKDNVEIITRSSNIPAYENFTSLAHNADTELFVWLADDDLWEPRYLEECIRALDRNAAAHCAFSHFRVYRHFDQTFGDVVKHLPSISWDKTLNLMIRSADMAPCAFYGVMRADILKWILNQAGNIKFDFSDVFFTLMLSNGGMMEIVPEDLFRSGVRSEAAIKRRSLDGSKLKYRPFIERTTKYLFDVLPKHQAIPVALHFWWRVHQVYQHHRKSERAA